MTMPFTIYMRNVLGLLQRLAYQSFPADARHRQKFKVDTRLI
jgi:hypothetical protein